jgi:SET domain-containing protein
MAEEPSKEPVTKRAKASTGKPVKVPAKPAPKKQTKKRKRYGSSSEESDESSAYDPKQSVESSSSSDLSSGVMLD